MLFSLTTNKIPGRTFPWLSRSVGTLKTYHTHTDKTAAARHWSLAVLLSIFSTDSTTSSATIEKPHHSTMHRVPKILGWSPSTDLLIFSSEVLLSCCSLCNIFEFPGFSGCRNVYHKGFKHNKLLLFSCGEAHATSCASAEACFTGWPNVQNYEVLSQMISY